MPIVEVENVTKRFRATRGTRILLGRGGLAEMFTRKDPGTVTALQDVSFTVEPGESLGIIGANGSGKSTLLKVIAGVTVPTEGNVRVQGRVASLLELGAGFHPMLTGRENVYLNAGILGMRHKQVDEVFDQILEFSGIGKFIDYPIGTYSSGMYVRLGFAVAAFTNPDIFLIDEVLSVGDEEFQRRCRQRIGQLIEMGKTIVFVSHDLGIVNSLCERVILLSQGKMILRDTTTKAIDFYLRQVGEERGLHTMRQGALEAIMCNGRISLFKDQEEITSASGLQFQVLHYGRWQSSLDADWTITEVTDSSCRATGEMAKLGLSMIWDIRIEDEELIWRVAIDGDDYSNIERLEAVLYFPTLYDRWLYDELDGAFPDILAEQTQWQQAVDPDLLCENAALLPPSDSDHPVISLHFGEHRPNFRGSWANTDYMTGSRVFKAEEHVGDESEGLPSGRHELISLRVSTRETRAAALEKLGEHSKKHAIEVGPLVARFDRGGVRLSHAGRQLTSGWNLYASLQIGHLWNDSTGYRWESFERTDAGIKVEGSSRRFPFKQIWELSPGENGIDITISLEALEAIDAQEYHVSIMLSPDYAQWATDHEKGAFPPITAEAHDWTHLNADYAVGTRISASADGLPAIELGSLDLDIPLRMTALNSSYFENSRVLQALRTPEHGSLHFEKGRHLLFRGEITVTP